MSQKPEKVWISKYYGRDKILMGLINKIVKYATNPAARFSYNNALGIYKKMNDKTFLERAFRFNLGYELDLDNPKTLNEKLQWLKIYDRHPEYTRMVDKYESKKFVASIIGEEHIIPTLGVWDKFEDIDFSILPNQFVLKCTHDSGGLVICRDQSKLDKERAKRKIEKSLKTNYYWTGREWPYKDVKPRIIAETYMEQEDGSGLIDYKFFCFNSVPRLLYVSRGLEHHPTAQIGFYDMNGNEMPFHRSDYKPYHGAQMPNNFDEMKVIAQKLAEEVDCPFVRIDLYSINGKIYFSEITFSPCSGMIPFEPFSADEELGKLIKLPIETE